MISKSTLIQLWPKSEPLVGRWGWGVGVGSHEAALLFSIFSCISIWILHRIGLSGIFLCMCSANERRHYIVTSSLNGLAHAQKYPWVIVTLRKVSFILPLNRRGPSYLGLTRSISCLLMPWLLTSPGHQQPWYWLCRICRYWSYLRKDIKYLCHIIVE